MVPYLHGTGRNAILIKTRRKLHCLCKWVGDRRVQEAQQVRVKFSQDLSIWHHRHTVCQPHLKISNFDCCKICHKKGLHLFYACIHVMTSFKKAEASICWSFLGHRSNILLLAWFQFNSFSVLFNPRWTVCFKHWKAKPLPQSQLNNFHGYVTNMNHLQTSQMACFF